MAEGTFVPNYKIDQGTLDRMKRAGKPMDMFGKAFDEFGEMGGKLFDWAIEKGGGVDALKARVAENKLEREQKRANKKAQKDRVDNYNETTESEDIEAYKNSIDNFEDDNYDAALDDWQGDTSISPLMQRAVAEPEISTPVNTTNQPEVSTDDLINNNFGWGIKNAQERGATMNTNTYDSFTDILKQKKAEFLEVQSEGGNTLNEIGKLTELSNGLQGFKKSLESVAEVHNTVGWSKALKPADKWMIDVLSDQTTTYPILNEDNRLAFVVTDPHSGEEKLATQNHLDDILVKNIKPAARELEYKKNNARLYDLGNKGGHFDIMSQYKTNLNAITKDNIESYMVDPWTGVNSFIEEAESDSTYNDLDISVSNLYAEALNHPALFQESAEVVARWVTAKQLQVFKNAQRDKKIEEAEKIEKIKSSEQEHISETAPKNLGERIATGIATAIGKTFGGNAWRDAQKVLYPTKRV